MPGEINNELIERLLARMDDISDIKIQLGIMASQLSTVVDVQKDLNLAIKGNGKPGLNDRVRNLEFSLADHKTNCPLADQVQHLQQWKDVTEKEKEDAKNDAEEEKKEQARERRNFKWGLLASIIMLLLSAGFELIQALSTAAH